MSDWTPAVDAERAEPIDRPGRGWGYAPSRVFGVVTVAAAAGLAWWLGDSTVGPVTPQAAFAQAPSETAHAVPTFGEAEKLAKLDGSMRESSGLAASHTRPGWLWTHGDSGGGPWLMRFDPWHGNPEKWTIRGASFRDWEDMASFTLVGEPYLLVADTGDNQRERSAVALHILPEPSEASAPSQEGETLGPVPVIEPVLTLQVTYEDGPRDCEAVAVDPAAGVVWLLSKEINAKGQMYGRSGLYAVALPSVEQWPDAELERIGTAAEPLVLERVATLDTVMPTAMDLTADGRAMLVGTYGDGLLFVREPAADPDWVQAIAGGPTRVSLPPRRQGEGLCFDLDASAVFLSSEKSEQPIWRIPMQDASR
ncbi:MAG: hypothetical protein AAGJ38_00785 [Planctomycetota bacterium]